MSILPQTKTVKKTDDPKNLIIFGLPKVGKTSSLAKLPNNLIIDLEDGTDYIEGFVYKANKIKDLYEVSQALRNEEHQFKFVTIDTITALEELAIKLACKNEGVESKEQLFNLPYGRGYSAHRDAVKEILSWFYGIGVNVILTAHVKDKSLAEGSTELNVKTLDLGGKLSNILSADSDAICYVYRDVENGNLMANFGDMNSVLTGARSAHLAGKTICLAERKQLENGNYDLITHWDTIYPSLNE
jgi:hypothetical protein